MKAFAGDRAGAQGNPFAARVLAGEDKLVTLRARMAKALGEAKAKRGAAEEALGKLAG